jgi:hypothetical protein
MPISLSISGDIRSEAALIHLPAPQRRPAEVMLSARNVTAVDAWSATSVRSLIDYFARYQQVNVVFEPPDDRAVWHLLCGALGTLPAHFILREPDGKKQPKSRPRNVILPARRIDTAAGAQEVGAGLAGPLMSNYRRSAANWIGGMAGALLDNAIRHPRDSPTAAIVSAMHERAENELQLVVSDLDTTVSRDPDAGAALEAMRDRSIENWGGLDTMVNLSVRRGLDISLTIAAGTGRLYWRGGRWTTAKATPVAGFTAAATVHLD